jgi:hypothetical protein
VVVPLAITGLSHRERAWQSVEARLVDDGWPILTGPNVSGLWCKSLAVEAAIHPTQPDDVLVVHDADVLVDRAAMRQAVERVEAGVVAWAMPHSEVHRLTAAATFRYYETGEVPEDAELLRWPYVGVEGGGAVVLRRSTYDDVPIDPRFLGWGDEDVCWGWALRTLLGAPWRATSRLVHLWHPHAAPGAQRSPRWESDTLRRRYRAAFECPARMRALALVDEIR